jgi:acyl carrier protein
MKEAIYNVIKQKINKSATINDDTTLVEVGIDSIDFINMVIALEEEFDIRFEDMQLIYDNYETLGQLVSVVQQVIEKKKDV